MILVLKGLLQDLQLRICQLGVLEKVCICYFLAAREIVQHVINQLLVLNLVVVYLLYRL